MSHGRIESGTYLYQNAVYKHQGTIVTQYPNGFKNGITYYPASVNNPKIFGYRPPANWYALVERWFISEGSIRWYLKPENLVWTAEGQISTFNDGDAAPYVTLDPRLADDVLRKVLSQMLEDDVAFNAFLLQGKQSLKMVANLATGLAHGTDRFMVANFKRPKSFRKFLANAGDKAISKFSGKYLEYLYGWKPLADDVQNAFQSMIDGYTGPERKQFRMSVRKSKKLRDGVVITRPASAYWRANWEWSQLMYRENRAKVVLHYEFPAQAGEMLPTMTPFGTAWEAAPWSFVIDWFIPVGDWIGAMEATQYAVYMKDAVLTQSVEVASRQSNRSYWTKIEHSDSEWDITYSKPPMISGKAFYMTREVLSNIQVLDRIRFPSFSSKFGLPQASQALALLSQVLNKWF